ncbi:MAG: hypothetical protein ACYSN9_08895, partial [Planctomycetota bacterium]
MKSRTHSILPLLIAVGFYTSILNASAGTLITEYEDQSSSASVQMGRMNGKVGIVVVFSGTDDLHYYATPEAAPAPHLALKITAQSEGLTFGDTIYPEYHYFNDPAKGKIEVYVGNFKVFLPITNPEASDEKTNATITIEGIACTSQLCLAPFTKEVLVDFDFSQAAGWPEVNFKTVVSEIKKAESSAASAVSDQDGLDRTVLMLLLALLGGVLFNVMPCVLPVLPLIISRMVNIAKESAGKRIKLGFSFCLGIISFFFIIAVISAAIR